jgi:dTDP-4-amino-4,6-dideoxygalactose transaminase
MNTLWDNVELFENLVSRYAGSKYAVAVDSCTNALFLCFKYCQVTGFDTERHVITVPTRTYISVPMQLKHAGYEIIFEDIEWSGAYQLSPLPVIDSAQRFTSNMYVDGTLQCLSFHSKKTLSIGRGGMILTSDKDARDWLIRSRYDGRSSIYYNQINSLTVPTLGWHMYMTPEQAVRGVEQFYKTPQFNNDSGSSSDYAIDLSLVDCLK